MTMLKPKVFLDHAPGDVYYLSKDRLVVGFDRPLFMDTPVTITIVCGGQNVTIQGAVEAITRRHQKYVGTIVWQDALQQQILDAFLRSNAGNFKPRKFPVVVANEFQKEPSLVEAENLFLKIQIEGLRAKKQDAALRISYRQQSAQDLLRQKEERLRSAQVDYEQALTQQRRLTPLHQKGYLSHIKWDTLKAEIIKAKTAVNEAQAALDQTKTDNQMIMASLDVPVGATPQDLDQEISEKIAQRENLKRQRRLLDERFQSLTLTSPLFHHKATKLG